MQVQILSVAYINKIMIINEQAIIDNAIRLGWKDCYFFTVKAHGSVDSSYCPEMRLSKGKFPPKFHWAALPKLDCGLCNSTYSQEIKK